MLGEITWFLLKLPLLSAIVGLCALSSRLLEDSCRCLRHGLCNTTASLVVWTPHCSGLPNGSALWGSSLLGSTVPQLTGVSPGAVPPLLSNASAAGYPPSAAPVLLLRKTEKSEVMVRQQGILKWAIKFYFKNTLICTYTHTHTHSWKWKN